MNHSPRKCQICGKYHCLAGCVSVEECQKLRRSNQGLVTCPKDNRGLVRWTGQTDYCPGAKTCGIIECQHSVPHARTDGCENGCFQNYGCSSLAQGRG